MKKSKSFYHGHRFRAGVISCAVRWYFRFQLSLRDIEELLFERGVIVTCETIRCWCLRNRFMRIYPTVLGLQAMRGVQFTIAVGMLSEVGDLSRFEHPRQLMAWMGVTRPEHSSGDKQRRRSIAKTVNSYGRQLLVEAAWSYRYPTCVSPRSSAGARASRRSSLIAPGTRMLDHVGAIAFMVSRWFQGI
ncbi:transposase IS116/IS110/IS902 family protein [Caballeronia udeis]|uniref:Transposase IS116/IS110/IS902 family protein n=1 Tax=Caballeronia udeis TaxID=1232866 RepID=A0A158J673_9BURK|nr:transposase IS116/IS110/IS902 family protein [Caballeronia udeis]